MEEYHSDGRKSFQWKEIIPMEENHSIGRKSLHWKEIIPLERNHSNPSGPHAGPLLISPTIQGTFSRRLKCSKGMKKKPSSMQNSKKHHWKNIIPMEGT